MNDEDRRTKAQIITDYDDQLARAQIEAAEHKKRLDNLDVEAKVIARCVVAFDQLPRQTSTAASWNAPRRAVADRDAVSRTIAYLANRYGLDDPQAEVKRLHADLAEERDRHMQTRASLEETRHRLGQIRDDLGGAV